MNKRELTEKLNTYYKNLAEASRAEVRERYAAALRDENFSCLERETRRLENACARARAAGTEDADATAALAAARAERDAYARERGYDFSPRYACESCRDSGYIDGRPCACRRKKELELLREACGLSRMPEFTFADNRLDNLTCAQSEEMGVLYDAMRKFCDRFDETRLRAVLLAGSVGVGKSSLAAAVADDLLSRGRYVLYLTAFDFVRVLMDKFLSKKEDSRSDYEALLECELLIVDDLGTETLYKNSALPYMLNVIDTRLREGKKLLVCTNLKAESFCARYGERIFSRLTNKTYALPYRYLGGTDLRRN